MKKLITFFILSIFCASNVLANDAKIKELEKRLFRSVVKRTDWENTIIIADEIIKYIPNHPEANFEKGKALSQLRRHQEAIAYFDIAIKNYHLAKYSNMVLNHSYYYKGYCLKRLGELEEALESYDLAIKHGFDDRSVYFARHGILMKLGRDID